MLKLPKGQKVCFASFNIGFLHERKINRKGLISTESPELKLFIIQRVPTRWFEKKGVSHHFVTK